MTIAPIIPARTIQAGKWTSTSGFALAALGAAVGLGNIWRFSSMAGENGGGAFILIYLLLVIGLGLPLMIAELALGKETEGNAVTAFEQIAARRPWKWVGWLGAAASVAILSYYPVVTGWVASYLWAYIIGDRELLSAHATGEIFDSLIKNSSHTLFWSAMVIAIAASIVAAGVEQGIELASKILMPLFAVLMIILAGYGLQLPGASRALEFLFAPDWTIVSDPKVWLAAAGQAFFSLSLATGVLVTFGSYVRGRERLPRAALVIAGGDTFIALLAGLIIFPVVFTHGVDPASGVKLIFIVLPEVFGALASGRWIALAFFFLLFVAALTSVVALLEVSVSLALAKFRWKRQAASAAVAVGIFLLSVPVILGYGILGDAWPTSRPLLDTVDHFTSNALLPLSGAAISLFAGWIWPRANALRASGLVRIWVQTLWIWLLRVVIPMVTALFMVRGLGWI